MANHAHNTRTPLLPVADDRLLLLGSGLGRQPGPVTVAIRAVRRRANPASDVLAAQHREERRALNALRGRIAAQFAFDAALLERAGA